MDTDTIEVTTGREPQEAKVNLPPNVLLQQQKRTFQIKRNSFRGHLHLKSPHTGTHSYKEYKYHISRAHKSRTPVRHTHTHIHTHHEHTHTHTNNHPNLCTHTHAH